MGNIMLFLDVKENFENNLHFHNTLYFQSAPQSFLIFIPQTNPCGRIWHHHTFFHR